ncbi:MAG: hypothetical protein KBC56_04780 [Flavobacterium sp.]|nr:hypothetical protein [Flavobacterium sp.]
MSTFKERLETEKQELDEKIQKLNEFLNGEIIKTIDAVQATLLNIQIQAMRTYSEILAERLLRL